MSDIPETTHAELHFPADQHQPTQQPEDQEPNALNVHRNDGGIETAIEQQESNISEGIPDVHASVADIQDQAHDFFPSGLMTDGEFDGVEEDDDLRGILNLNDDEPRPPEQPNTGDDVEEDDTDDDNDDGDDGNDDDDDDDDGTYLVPRDDRSFKGTLDRQDFNDAIRIGLRFDGKRGCFISRDARYKDQRLPDDILFECLCGPAQPFPGCKVCYQKQRVAALKTPIKQMIEVKNVKMRKEIKAHKAEMKKKVKAHKADMRKETKTLKAKFEETLQDHDAERRRDTRLKDKIFDAFIAAAKMQHIEIAALFAEPAHVDGSMTPAQRTEKFDASFKKFWKKVSYLNKVKNTGPSIKAADANRVPAPVSNELPDHQEGGNPSSPGQVAPRNVYEDFTANYEGLWDHFPDSPSNENIEASNGAAGLAGVGLQEHEDDFGARDAEEGNEETAETQTPGLPTPYAGSRPTNHHTSLKKRPMAGYEDEIDTDEAEDTDYRPKKEKRRRISHDPSPKYGTRKDDSDDSDDQDFFPSTAKRSNGSFGSRTIGTTSQARKTSGAKVTGRQSNTSLNALLDADPLAALPGFARQGNVAADSRTPDQNEDNSIETESDVDDEDALVQPKKIQGARKDSQGSQGSGHKKAPFSPGDKTAIISIVREQVTQQDLGTRTKIYDITLWHHVATVFEGRQNRKVSPNALRMLWSRELRVLSGVDERKKKNANLMQTSLQKK